MVGRDVQQLEGVSFVASAGEHPIGGQAAVHDKDTVHARRVNRTDFRGIGHPTLSLGNSRHSMVWGRVWCPLSRSEN